jgi:hypothetical protein
MLGNFAERPALQNIPSSSSELDLHVEKVFRYPDT